MYLAGVVGGFWSSRYPRPHASSDQSSGALHTNQLAGRTKCAGGSSAQAPASSASCRSRLLFLLYLEFKVRTEADDPAINNADRAEVRCSVLTHTRAVR